MCPLPALVVALRWADSAARQDSNKGPHRAAPGFRTEDRASPRIYRERQQTPRSPRRIRRAGAARPAGSSGTQTGGSFQNAFVRACCAILLTGSYPARFNNLSSSAGVHSLRNGRRAAASPDFFALAGWRSSKAALLAFLRNSLMRFQQSKRFQCGTSSRTRLIASRFWAGPSLIPAISNRSIAANCLLGLLPFRPGALGIAQPHYRKVKVVRSHRATRWNSPAASVIHDQSRAKLAAFRNAVPRSWYRTSFLWTKERLIVSRAESTLSLHVPARDCRCSWRPLAAALLSGDARSAVYCPTLTKGTSGREKYQKKVIA